MKEFRQKAYGVIDTVGKYGSIAMNTIGVVGTHSQLKQTKQDSLDQLAKNEEDFKQMMQQKREEHREKMNQVEKQKIFFWGAAAKVALNAMPILQGQKSNKIAEETAQAQLAQQAKFQKQQLAQDDKFQKEQMKLEQQKLKSKEKIAKINAKAGMTAMNAENPVMSAASVNPVMAAYSDIGTCKMSDELQKEFSINFSGIAKNAKGLVSDLGKAGKQLDLGQKAANAAAGATMAVGASYLVDRALFHNAKKSGMIQEDESQQEKPKKTKAQKIKTGLALAGTAAGTALLATNKNVRSTVSNAAKKLGTGFKNQVISGPGTAEQIQEARENLVGKKGLGKTLAERRLNRLSDGKSHLNTKNLITVGVTAAALPTVEHAISKRQFKKQQEAQDTTEEAGQRTYSFKSILDSTKRVIKTGASGAKSIVSAGLESATAGTGVSGQKKFGNALKAVGDSGSTWTKGVADFMSSDKHKALKTAGGILVGAKLVSLPSKIAEKTTKKALGKVDKKAFAYQNSRTAQVPAQKEEQQISK